MITLSEPRARATETVWTNATLVLPDAVVAGTLVIRDGLLAEIQPGS